ncbi:MAG: hypothetical protein ACE5GI_09320, partial [Candidatus Aminicenantales bacterium]
VALSHLLIKIGFSMDNYGRRGSGCQARLIEESHLSLPNFATNLNHHPLPRAKVAFYSPRFAFIACKMFNFAL